MLGGITYGQEENPVKPGSTTEQQLENLTEQQDGETEDDSYLQSLVQFKRNPINLNTVEENDLKELRMISDLQIQNFLNYRRLLGNLISVYELQSIPTWDVETIQKVLPYLRVANIVSLGEDMTNRLTGGRHSILMRMQQTLEKSDGFLRPDSIVNRYPGGPQRFLFRYKYVYKNLFQYGLTAEKDPGEQFFKGGQKQGFDFYSFHLFARKLGPVKLLALGDFTANFGQGLIQWQSLAFKKSADITNVKRQSEVLRPYNSAGEYNFQRGVGATVGITRNVDVTGFASVRQLDGTVNAGDTLQTNDDFVSSILNSGYHRTPAELAKKNTLTQTSFGGNVNYKKNNFHLGASAVSFHFSNPISKDIQTYNQYAIQGSDWYNYSLDYSYTYRNIHLFGEVASDKNNSKAFVGGLLASLDAKVDASVVYRNIDKEYQTLYGNAFTEGTFPTNEKGLFLGLSLKPYYFLKIDGYADAFSFPWLRYRVDAPTQGTEYLLQITYKPSKQVEVYTRFRNQNKLINLSGLGLSVRPVANTPTQNWRTQVTYNVSKEISLRTRAEILWFANSDKNRSEQGFLGYVEAKYKPFSQPFSINSRLQYFETGGFNSRLYAFENDVLYSYSIPQFIGKGFRYYINLNYDVSKKMTFWVRWAQTIYSNVTSISNSLDKIDGNRRSDVKVQMMYSF